MKRFVLLSLLTPLVLGRAESQTQAPGPRSPGKVVPRLEPVAETKLLMEGMAHPNFKGLERILRQGPQDNQTWTFGRGQALLIAETANLLLLRPPKNQGQETWFARAMELRERSTQLAKTFGAKDFDESRARFVQLANSCNRCHQSFRVPVQIEPFADASTNP